MNPQDEVTPINGQLPPVIPQDEVSTSVAVNNGVAQTNSMSEPQGSSAIQNNPTRSSVSSGQASKSPHAPSIADDNDLIEKEWVNRAKMIIAKTLSYNHFSSIDPFLLYKIIVVSN